MRWRRMRQCRPTVQRHSTQQRENESQPDERLGYQLFHCLAFLIDVWNVQQRFIEIGLSLQSSMPGYKRGENYKAV